MSFYVNPDIKNTIRHFPRQNRGDFLRLDMNENINGLPKEFVDDVLSEITPEFLSMYPEPDLFLKVYANYIGLDSSYTMATNGSDMAIRYILETFGEKGKDVVTVMPTFAMYAVNCSILGYNHVGVEYETDLTISVDKIISAITENTRIVVLINPNNPIGNTYDEDEAKRIISKANEVGAIVIIDEAYHYYCKETLLPMVSEFDNVIVLRTFSKLCALAALRLGVIIANPRLIEYVKNSRMTFEVNSIALLFGKKLLESPEIIEELIETEKKGRDYLKEKLQSSSYEYIDCKGNFILIKTKTNPHEIVKRLESEKRILAYDFNNPLLEKYIRINTGDAIFMSMFYEALISIDNI